MEKEFWVVKILILTAFLIGLNYVLKFALRYLHRKFLTADPKWKVDFETIIYLPCHVVLWVIGIAYGLEILGYRFNLWIEPAVLTNVRNALIVGCLTWIVLKWKRAIQNSCAAKAVDPQTVWILGRVGSIVIFAIAAMFILQILGLDVMPLVAFGGIGAAAIGFASKDVIANFCSGLMIYITRPFTVGEWIILPDKDVEVFVEEIGWYLTAVRDKYKRPVYLPNSIFSQMLVINSSRMSHRRILEKISIRYEDFAHMKALVEEIRQEISKHPRIDTHYPILVSFYAFHEYSLEIQVDVYTFATVYEEYLTVKQEVLARIYEVILAHGAQMPFPTMTLHSPSSK